MAKKRSKSKSPKAGKKQEQEDKVTMEALTAMSDDSDDDGDLGDASQWNTKAKSLKDAIDNGKFDHLIDSLKRSHDDEEDEMEEATLDSSSEEEEKVVLQEEDPEDEEVSESPEEEEEVDQEDEQDDDEQDGSGDPEQDSEEEDNEEEEEDSEDEKARKLASNNQTNAKALAVVTAELSAVHKKLPWPETLDVVPPTPLPFGGVSNPESNPLDIHDDLKREVAFYNSALEAVNEARSRCNKAGIPFTRPADFFAEMVKTDDHMAKVKDRLIFEGKKIEAVAQRKANKEQKLRAKESQAHRLAEKSKRKRDHFQQVEEWANSAARNRGGALQDDADEVFMRGSNKKRQKADLKFGHGGKRGRFKQNDRASMNDMSGFNPRGNFSGIGTKRSAKSKGGSGANRQGKRARDSNRARHN